MPKNPFLIKAFGDNIFDSDVTIGKEEVDGDILVANSYRKHPQLTWTSIKKIRIMYLMCILLFIVLASKLYYLQVIRGAEYYGTAEGNRIRKISIQSARGVIFDSNQKRIAYNVPDFSILVVPADLPKSQDDEDVIFTTISEVVGVDHFDLVESFARAPRTSYSVIEIVRGLAQEQAILLKRKSQDWQGVYITASEQRTYDMAQEFSHIIGYTAKMSEQEYTAYKRKGYKITEHVGKIGIEKQYQESLRGIAGEQFVEVDSYGRPEQILKETIPAQGDNLYLSINSDLQTFIWNELTALLAEHELQGGSVIVMNPKDGSVLAMVSFPGYDIDLFAKGIDFAAYEQLLADPAYPLFNRVISGEYASGSTFKIVVGAAALEEEIITQHTSIISTGGISVNEYWFPDWRYGGHGKTNIIHALADSVNTFFYAIGGGYQHIDGLGVKKITNYGKKFGLSQPTGIDLTGENSGFLPSKDWKEEAKGERWYLGDTYHLAIGQGDILVTPIQVANFTAAIANGGTLYAPRIVRSIGKTHEKSTILEPVIIQKQVASKNTVNIIQSGLRSAVTYGSAVSISTLPIPIAGKTGTAQFSSEKPPHAWFTGFAPYKNPEIVVTVLIEEGEGGTITATPLAKKIFEYYFGND